MGKKVNFFTVDLHESANSTRRDYKEIRDLLIVIIDEQAVILDDFWVPDLTSDNKLHYVADIFFV